MAFVVLCKRSLDRCQLFIPLVCWIEGDHMLASVLRAARSAASQTGCRNYAANAAGGGSKNALSALTSSIVIASGQEPR